jgi:hypothetical protein
MTPARERGQRSAAAESAARGGVIHLFGWVIRSDGFSPTHEISIHSKFIVMNHLEQASGFGSLVCRLLEQPVKP